MPKVEKWRQLYDSLKPVVAQLEEKVYQLQKKIDLLELEKRQWDAEKVKQQMIIQQALTNSNQTNSAYLEEIKRLREELTVHHCDGCDGSDGGS